MNHLAAVKQEGGKTLENKEAALICPNLQHSLEGCIWGNQLIKASLLQRV